MKDNELMQLINSSGQGGAETVVKEIIRNLDCCVFCLKKDKIERFSEFSSNVFFGTESKNYKFNPFILIKLLRLIKKREIRLLHVHLGASLFYAILVKILRPNLTVIYHEHGEIFYNKKLKLLIKYFGKKIDSMIAVSKSAKNEIVKRTGYNPKKIIILYNFVNLEYYNKNINFDRDKERNLLGINEEDFVIGFVGRLTEIKGCRFLIESLPLLNFRFKVIIAGDGPLMKEMKTLVEKMQVKKRVIFLGYVNDLRIIYPLLDVCVLPSRTEASPMVFYEAQAYGIPIIGSDVPAINEFIKPNKNGLLYQFGNSKELAEKISYLYKNPALRKKMSAYSIKNIQKYSLESFISKLKRIYNEYD